MARKPIGDRERKMLLVLGGVLVLAIAAFLLFGSSDTTTPTLITPPSLPQHFPGAIATPTAAATSGSFDTGTTAKDPFEPAGGYVVPSSGPAPGGPAPSGSPAPSSTGSPRSPTPQPTGGVPGHSKIVLLDIYSQHGTRFASVQVDQQVHNVKEGDTFARVYRVVTITDHCATFVQGDERFTLCIGQQVYK